MAVDTTVRIRTLDWKELVLKAWGKEWNKPEKVYEFTQRTFTEPKVGGPYSGSHS